MKRLELEVLTTKWGGVKLLRISKQTHISKKFGNVDCSSFVAKNNFMLISDYFPKIKGNILYVRGQTSLENNDVLLIPSDEWLTNCKKAVKEYNEYFKEENKIFDDVEIIR